MRGKVCLDFPDDRSNDRADVPDVSQVMGVNDMNVMGRKPTRLSRFSQLSWITAATVFGILLGGCASTPPPDRLEVYLSRDVFHGVRSEMPLALEPSEAGIALIEDIRFEASAPALSEEGRIALIEYLRGRVEARLPLRIVSIVPTSEEPKEDEGARMLAAARNQGLEYLVLAVHASEEQTSPAWLTIMTGSIGLLGERTRNFALVEMSLIEVKSGEVVATTRGRAIATLEQLSPPMATTLYPVVYPSLRETRIFAMVETAEETLRVVAGKEASDAAVSRLH